MSGREAKRVLSGAGSLVAMMALAMSSSSAFAQSVDYGSLEQLFATISNITDVVGIAFLIYGFISIIKHERVEEKHIQDLERMLPLCASCKKYRTEDGKWMPIENYLLGLGGARLTHGICPECTTKLYGDILDRKSG